jgi:hypothetical protein
MTPRQPNKRCAKCMTSSAQIDSGFFAKPGSKIPPQSRLEIHMIPEQQARQRKLLRIFGPGFLVLGLAWLALQFMG